MHLERTVRLTDRGTDAKRGEGLAKQSRVAVGAQVGPVVTPQRKRTLLQMIADVEGCTVEQARAGTLQKSTPRVKVAI